MQKEDVARMTGGLKKNSNKTARKPPKGASAPSLASVEEDNVLDPISPSVVDKSKIVSEWDISGASGEGAPPGAKYSFEILCPDGSIMEINRSRQTLRARYRRHFLQENLPRTVHVIRRFRNR